MPAPTASTGVKGSISGAALIDSGSAGATAALVVPDSASLVTVVTVAFRYQGSAGNLINGVTLAGGAMTLAVRKTYQDGASSGSEICIWYSMNVSSGSKTIALDFVNEDDSTLCNWHGDSWTTIATSSALDVTSSSDNVSAATSINVPASGSTSTLAQAAELVIAVAFSKWNWTWGGTYGGAGTAPSGYTLITGLTEDNTNTAIFQSAYKDVSATTGVSATWAKENTGLNLAALATFKIGTTQRRVKVLADTAIDGATGITAYAWVGDPDSVLAEKWTSLTAESSGGIVYLTNPPAGWTTGTDVNVVLYQPAGDKRTTGFVVGLVEEY